jgi:hypothetical protein
VLVRSLDPNSHPAIGEGRADLRLGRNTRGLRVVENALKSANPVSRLGETCRDCTAWPNWVRAGGGLHSYESVVVVADDCNTGAVELAPPRNAAKFGAASNCGRDIYPRTRGWLETENAALRRCWILPTRPKMVLAVGAPLYRCWREAVGPRPPVVVAIQQSPYGLGSEQRRTITRLFPRSCGQPCDGRYANFDCR